MTESRSAALREAVIASLAVVLGLGLIKHLVPLIPGSGTVLATIALAAQLYVPVWRSHDPAQELGLRLDRWRRDLVYFLGAAVVVTVPYAVGFGWWFEWADTFVLRFPAGFWRDLFLQTLVVALAEEVYFRGYLQERWRHGLEGRVGIAIVVTSVVFGLAHFAGEYVPGRLAPALPSLLFGWLRHRTGTVVAATVFHAYCNGLAEVMFASYRP